MVLACLVTHQKISRGESAVLVNVQCPAMYLVTGRVSFETSFDSKQPKLGPKPVLALSETKRLFRLFRFYTETSSFGVSIEPKQTEDPPLFPILTRVTRPVIRNREISFYRVKTGFPPAAKILPTEKTDQNFQPHIVANCQI